MQSSSRFAKSPSVSLTIVVMVQSPSTRGCLCLLHFGRSFGRCGAIDPAISKSGIRRDAVKLVVHFDELLANALDEGADVCAITVLAITGHEAGTTNDVVNLAMRNIAIGLGRQVIDDL